MKKTIILGNGFDLDLGFPTSYKNFIESTSFASNLWSGMHLAYGIGPHPSNLFRYIQSKAAEDPSLAYSFLSAISGYNGIILCLKRFFPN